MQSIQLKIPIDVEARLSGDQMKEVAYEVIRKATGLSPEHFIKNKKLGYNNKILGPHAGQDILEKIITKKSATQFHKDILLLYKKIEEL